MVRDAQNPSQIRNAGGATHTAVVGVTAKAGGSDHVGATAGATTNNYVIFTVAPGDVLLGGSIIDLLEVYVGAGSAALPVSLVWGTDNLGAGGTVVVTMADIRAATPKSAVAAAQVDFVNGGSTNLYITLRYAGAAGATLAGSTAGLIGVQLPINRKADRFHQAYN